MSTPVSGMPGPGTSTPGGSTSQPPANFANLPVNANAPLTPHAGLEIMMTKTNAIVASPNATILVTNIGFTLALPDGRTAIYDTRAGASNTIAPNTYTYCVAMCTAPGFASIAMHSDVTTTLTNGKTSPFADVIFGAWYETDFFSPVARGVFATGLTTASNDVPHTGTLTYNGALTGVVHTGGTLNTFSGDIALRADLAAGQITGTATNMVAIRSLDGHTPAGLLNDIVLSAGVINGTRFSGSAAPVAATPSTTLDLTNATGQFGGSFYGPGAHEAGGSFSLSSSEAGIDVIAAFGAGTATPQASLPTLLAGYPIFFVPHAGLEIFSTEGGYPNLRIQSNPAAAMETAVDGFVLDLLEPTPRDASGKTADSRKATVTAPMTFQMSYPAGRVGSCVGTCTETTYPPETVTVTLSAGKASALSYATYGVWDQETATDLLSFGAFAGGVQTPVAQVPSTGTATYIGNVAGAAFNLPTSASSVTSVAFTGTATFNADFAQHAVTGAFTGLSATNRQSGAALGTMSDIALSAGNIAGAAFTGSAAAMATSGSVVNLNGMTGRFGGEFFGPNAAEVAGTAALAGNGASLIAAFGAKR